jgi:hypothetical protein
MIKNLKNYVGGKRMTKIKEEEINKITKHGFTIEEAIEIIKDMKRGEKR